MNETPDEQMDQVDTTFTDALREAVIKHLEFESRQHELETAQEESTKADGAMASAMSRVRELAQEYSIRGAYIIGSHVVMVNDNSVTIMDSTHVELHP